MDWNVESINNPDSNTSHCNYVCFLNNLSNRKCHCSHNLLEKYDLWRFSIPILAFVDFLASLVLSACVLIRFCLNVIFFSDIMWKGLFLQFVWLYRCFHFYSFCNCIWYISHGLSDGKDTILGQTKMDHRKDHCCCHIHFKFSCICNKQTWFISNIF